MKSFASRHRLSTFIIAYVSVFLVLGWFGYHMSVRMGMARLPPPSHHFATDMSYLDLPRMVVSVGGSGEGGGGIWAPRVRLDITLEVAGKDAEILRGYQPQIMEKIAAYMMKLKPEDLTRRGSMQWLRGELLNRINNADMPVPVHDVLFRELIIM